MALLTFEEARVLGCLIEKSMATPDYYPMTLNQLVTACNQTSNREPVTAYEERVVEDALTSLRQKKLAAMIHLSGSRAPKYKHLLSDYYLNLGEAEAAVLSVMMLRGPQTTAELRTRTERLHAFAHPQQVEETIQRLIKYGNGTEPLAVTFPAGGGRRVATHMHLLCGEEAASAPIQPVSAGSTIIPPPPAPSDEWKEGIEGTIASLQAEIEALRARVIQLEDLITKPE